MRITVKSWLSCGLTIGLAIPFAMRIYERVLILGPVRPIVQWLFWPASLLFHFSHSSTSVPLILLLLTILTNALLFAWIASLSRRRFPILILLMLVVAWFFLPPSDKSLRRHFSEHQDEFERLVQMANRDLQLARIKPTLVETIDGKTFNASEPQNLISEGKWAEYRRLFKAAGVNDGLYRSQMGGDIFVNTIPRRRIDPVGSSLGYLYCPAANQPYGFVPCMEDQESGVGGGYRWERLGSGWYISEVFRKGAD